MTANEPRDLATIKMFSARFPAFTEGSLRRLIFEAEPRLNSRGETVPGNGLLETGAVVRIGRRVLLDTRAFFGPWLAQQQQRRKAA